MIYAYVVVLGIKLTPVGIWVAEIVLLSIDSGATFH